MCQQQFEVEVMSELHIEQLKEQLAKVELAQKLQEAFQRGWEVGFKDCDDIHKKYERNY